MKVNFSKAMHEVVRHLQQPDGKISAFTHVKAAVVTAAAAVFRPWAGLSVGAAYAALVLWNAASSVQAGPTLKTTYIRIDGKRVCVLDFLKDLIDRVDPTGILPIFKNFPEKDLIILLAGLGISVNGSNRADLISNWRKIDEKALKKWVDESTTLGQNQPPKKRVHGGQYWHKKMLIEYLQFFKMEKCQELETFLDRSFKTKIILRNPPPQYLYEF